MKKKIISCGPFLTMPEPGRMRVVFTTTVPAAGSCAYRRAGTKRWKILKHISGGQIKCSETTHTFQLAGLAPGAEIEYRVTAVDFQGNCEEKSSHFTAFDPEKKKFSFLVLADLQFPQERRCGLIRYYCAAAEAEKCDFLVSLGDLCSRIDSFRENILEDHIQLFCELGADRRPLVCLRGNHELRGRESCRWEEFFGRPYYLFRQGAAAFLGIDSWSDQPSCNGPNFACNQDRAFLKEEKRFVRRAVRQKSFLEAPFRIVLSHGASHSHIDQFDFLGKNLREMTDDLFRGKDPAVRLHLWICGHIHHYIRSVPGKAECVSISPPPQPVETPEDYVFPVVTTDGPDVQREIVPPSGIQSSAFKVTVTSENVTVCAISEERGVIDEFSIDSNGIVTDLAGTPHHFWKSGKA